MKILTIIGARPQFIKASVVSNAFKSIGIEEILLHTGQHFDANMSQIFFEQMQIPQPLYQLDIHGGHHGEMTGKMLAEIEKIILLERPDYVLVYGDTNSTLAGALAAKKLHVKVIHIEAGLRSFNIAMPEEINRILTDRISNVLFCPTAIAVENLKQEGFEHFDCEIEMVGDVMYDSFVHFSAMQQQPQISHVPNQFVLATIHRAENTDRLEHLQHIIQFLNTINEKFPIILPIHPRTKGQLHCLNVQPNFMMIDPVGYLEMLWLLQHAAFVVTDSGGLQKEAYFAQKKCLTLRGETEWTELVDYGWNVLYNPGNEMIFRENDLKLPEVKSELYGRGDASRSIASYLRGE
jgi:UDP-GlcNAc3NAcA epimerase